MPYVAFRFAFCSALCAIALRSHLQSAIAHLGDNSQGASTYAIVAYVYCFTQDLEHREKQYDGREYLDVYTSDSDSEPALCNVLTFVATSKSVNWLGPASLESVAQQIAAAIGPSGPNHEYLDLLAKALWKV